MATGTGLPVPKDGDVRTQPITVHDADKLFDAQSWLNIAASGAKLSDAAADWTKKDAHQQQVRYYAEQDIADARKATELRDTYREDPQGFDQAWRAHTEGSLSQAPSWAIAHRTRTLGNYGNSAYSSLLSEKRGTDKRLASDAWTALVDQTQNQVTSAALAGTLGEASGIAAVEKYRGVIQTGVTSQFIAPEEGERRIANLTSTATVYAARGAVKSAFESGGMANADKFIEDTTRDEKLQLSPEQRFGLASRLRADVRGWQSEKEANVAPVRLEAQELIAAKKNGMPVTQARLDETVERFKKFGEFAAAADFLAQSAYVDEHSSLARAPVAESAARIGSMQGRINGTALAPAIAQTANNLGIAPRDLAAAISYETGGTFNPNMWGGKGGNYLGLIQFGPEEREKYGVRPGMNAADQMKAVESFLRDRGVRPGMGISEIYRTINGGNPNANLNASDGNGTIAQHIARIQAGHYGTADSILSGGTAAPGGIKFVGEETKALRERVGKVIDSIETDMKAGTLPDEGRLSSALSGAAAANDPELLNRVRRVAQDWQYRRDVGKAPPAESAAVIARDQQLGQIIGASEEQAESLRVAKEVHDQKVQGLKSDPLKYTMSAAGDAAGLTVPAPLNTGDSNSFRAGLQQRATWARYGQDLYKQGPMPALTAADVAGVSAAIDAADPRGQARIFSDITAAIPDEATRNATFAKLGQNSAGAMVKAYAGALFSRDPALGESILRGQRAIEADPRNNPVKEDKAGFADALDKALPASAFTVAGRTNPSGAWATMRSAVIARYADLTASDPRAGKDFNEDRMIRAVSDVTGGVLKHNSGSVIAPQRGMTQAQFDASMAGITDADLAGMTTLSGQPITANFLRRNARLESVGQDRYLVQVGLDPANPQYAVYGADTEAPSPFIFNVVGRRTTTTRRGTLRPGAEAFDAALQARAGQ